jgi:hypothetical protein
MEEKTLDKLKQEADQLGIEYAKNIGAEKLSAKIEEFYAKESEGSVVEEAPVEVAKENSAKSDDRFAETGAKTLAEHIAIIKKREAETKVVKITMVDRRESANATHAYFSNGDASMNVPLDVFVEMPNSLIYLAEKAKALTHIDENGQSVPKMQKKYVVEYK